MQDIRCIDVISTAEAAAAKAVLVSHRSVSDDLIGQPAVDPS